MSVAAAAAAAPQVDGFVPSASDIVNEAPEYEHILRLRDEIFAGTHPRLTVPAHAIRKVSPLSASSTNVPPPFHAAAQPTQLPGLSLAVEEEKQADEQNVNTGSAMLQTKSGIDPVLLMKSDELVKAETQLHRQRLEKALRDQFEQKRIDARKRPALGEAKPDFDVAAVLVKAQEVAKPEAAATPKEDASNSDSYDANSLYSSRAPDSTPEVGELEDAASSQPQNLYGASFGANGPAETQTRYLPTVATTAQPQQHPDTPPAAVAAAAAARKSSGAVDLSVVDNDDEEEEEGEYSPPEAVEQFANPADASLQTTVDPRSRPLRRYSELDDNGKRPGSPGDNMRIVRNHITSPIAPQPSRVSPLAVAKDPLSLQNPRLRNGRGNQRARAGSPRQSPDGSGPGLHPRKKRKLEKKAERRRRNGGASPDIKDEPVSPPPFHDVQPLGSGRPRPANDDRPIVIDDGPVREVRYVQPADPYPNSPMRPLSRQGDTMMPLSEPRVLSRSTIRPVRDDTDLRRVASMHSMRVEQPREYVDVHDTPTRGRAPSYMRVESPMRVETSRLVQDTPPSYAREANQGMRVTHTPAPVYREVYQAAEPEVRYVPEPLPPPTVERIVVDQYGRRFREIIQDRSSMAPRAYSTIPERDQPPYYENFDRGRGQSVVIEARPDGRLAQEMPPPPQIIRQVADPGPGFRDVYEPLPPTRSGSARPVDQSPRQPVYVDDRGEYRAPVRIGSVRPVGARYEDMAPPPPSMAVRASSVRPGAREGSVFVDDRSQVRREYLPVEAPRYRVLEPETRYVDAQGREITYIDGPQDGGARYVQRY